ncbi:hypothetical protein J6590_101282 [Homalodisca vitripennis]|nr:hypothetical protein J6590_101282 [Homalodisca vitripennis]
MNNQKHSMCTTPVGSVKTKNKKTIQKDKDTVTAHHFQSGSLKQVFRALLHKGPPRSFYFGVKNRPRSISALDINLNFQQKINNNCAQHTNTLSIGVFYYSKKKIKPDNVAFVRLLHREQLWTLPHKVKMEKYCGTAVKN